MFQPSDCDRELQRPRALFASFLESLREAIRRRQHGLDGRGHMRQIGIASLERHGVHPLASGRQTLSAEDRGRAPFEGRGAAARCDDRSSSCVDAQVPTRIARSSVAHFAQDLERRRQRSLMAS